MLKIVPTIFAMILIAACTERSNVGSGYYLIQANGSQLSLLNENDDIIVGNDITALIKTNSLLLFQYRIGDSKACSYVVISRISRKYRFLEQDGAIDLVKSTTGKKSIEFFYKRACHDSVTRSVDHN